MMSAQLQQQQPNGPVATTTTPAPQDSPSSREATAMATTTAPTENNPAFPPLRNHARESSSPYVQRHGDTPVAWQPLDAKALDRAVKENKPIFMHIGFLADHHCRLTTQDSFSHPLVAAFLNHAFIPIIVDREERPDLDTIYQNYSEAVNATGGWPLNLFLTPDLYPIFGETYWPGPGTEHSLAAAALADDHAGDGEEACIDFLALSKKIHNVWEEQEERCRREAFEMLSKLQDFAQEGTFSSTTAATLTRELFLPERGANSDEADVDLDQVEEALGRIAQMFDPTEYGFGTPKFPNPARLSFLLRLAQFPDEVKDVVGEKEVENATNMALGTLRRIRDGGLHDHVGAGFMRFSVTRDWSVPHFEKMVGENALLLGVFLDAWLEKSGSLVAEDEFVDVVFELADYLTSPLIRQEGGGFVTSEAADSFYRRGDRHMREGAYYLWTRREFDHVVGSGASDGQHASLVAAAHWNVLEHGNVPRDQDPHDEFINQNVLYAVKDVHELSKQFGIPVSEVQRILASARENLRSHREKERVRPGRDEKVVVNINGMVIAALARTAAAVRSVDAERSTKYLDAAKKAAAFVKHNLWVAAENAADKTMRRFFYQEPSATLAFADDYAFLIEGLLGLYESTLEREWLSWAKELQDTQTRLFYDPISRDEIPSPRRAYSGGFYSTEEQTLSHTILRLKSGMDKSQPSTNAVSASNLFVLGTLLGDATYIRQAKDTIFAFEAEILQYPWLFVSLLSGVVTVRLGVKEVRVSAREEKLRQYYTTPRAEARALVLVAEPEPEQEPEPKPEPVELDPPLKSELEQEPEPATEEQMLKFESKLRSELETIAPDVQGAKAEAVPAAQEAGVKAKEKESEPKVSEPVAETAPGVTGVAVAVEKAEEQPAVAEAPKETPVEVLRSGDDCVLMPGELISRDGNCVL
ncbi:hypothetical protein B0T25DRAFT_563528 [Lasiosphaeria hispida]|uniref:Spermatogenesis-associated protein 20-like TRX domain-containing protein n=1 Tax=Lasiosphaeria hispida TaxID=260671 RepID=A0AAJ0ML60_9PEZI|nr:hypothetical protein B0T25DRAFT_563528 [Lasiosphaeria hispida]